jgi:hypothetical protein
VRAEGEADVDQRLVVRLRRGFEGREVADHRAERERRGDRRQQHAQQMGAQASRRHRALYLNSSSM